MSANSQESLRKDLRGEIKVTSKGAEAASRSLELWGVGWSKGARRGDSIGRKGMSLTSQPACQREGRDKVPRWKAQTRKENVFARIRQRLTG
jgi:hypothetical protein